MRLLCDQGQSTKWQRLHLPVEAIREALAYFEANPEVIALDHATEMYLLSQEGSEKGSGSAPRSLEKEEAM